MLAKKINNRSRLNIGKLAYCFVIITDRDCIMMSYTDNKVHGWLDSTSTVSTDFVPPSTVTIAEDCVLPVKNLYHQNQVHLFTLL